MGVKWSEVTPRERDAVVAQHVMGWTRVERLNGLPLLMPPVDSEYAQLTGLWDVLGIPQYLPHYTTDISAAWEVLEKFEYHEIMKYPPSKREFVSLFNNGTWYRAEAETVQEAICLAALKAVGVDVE